MIRRILISFCLAGLASLHAQETLKPPSSFEYIDDERLRSQEIFRELGKVLQHPRCVNCHPDGNSPLQGNAGNQHLHHPMVVRGEDTHGVPAMKCGTCHAVENVTVTDQWAMPGHDPWHLAPAEMAWEGKTLAQICEQLKDMDRNGGKTPDDMIKHMAEDGLVGWGWKPGEGRDPVPGSQKLAGDLTRAWYATGAHCPD